jgi:hypothetical protein
MTHHPAVRQADSTGSIINDRRPLWTRLARWRPRAMNVVVVLLGAAVGLLSGVAGPAVAQPMPGWRSFRDGRLEVSHPPAWTVKRDAATGRLDLHGPRGERLSIWPFFVGSSLTPAAASHVLSRMASTQAPKVIWGPSRPVGPTGLRSEGRADADSAVASLAWTASPRGTAAQFLLASAPGDRRQEADDTIARILASVRVSGPADTSPGAGPVRPDVTFVRFQDPAEGAFSLDVPQGWRVTGGLLRKAPVDVRSGVVASSPDNQVHLRIGDVEIPTFTTLTPMMAQLGFREGAPYSPGYGVNMIVMRYRPGEQFARYWVTSRVGSVCPGLEIVGARPLPQTVHAMNAIMAQHGSPVMRQQLHAGDTAFRCRQNQAPAVGYLFVATLLTAGNDGGALWNVDQLQGYLSPPERAGQAQSILAHMIGSAHLNPQWVRMQQNVTAATSRIVADTNAHISKVITDSYWSRQASQDELSRKRSNQILGLEDTRDPVTGRELKVESGSNYYWIDHRGNIAGTDIHSRPSLDFRELVRLP